MPVHIDPDLCLGCTSNCIPVCWVRAIAEIPPDSPHNPEPGLVLTIEANLCTECVGVEDTPQCVAACPTEAIIYNEDDPTTQQEDVLTAKTNMLKAHHVELGLPENIAFNNEGGQGLEIPKGFGPHPEHDFNAEYEID